MILVAIAIGIILIVAALRNTYGALFSALGQDVPAFVVWAAALVALGAIGYVPGLRPISRGLMALVILVILVQNYSNILTGFKAVASPGTGATMGSTSSTSVSSGSSTTPATSSAASPTNQTLQTLPNYLELAPFTSESAFSSAGMGGQ